MRHADYPKSKAQFESAVEQSKSKEMQARNQYQKDGDWHAFLERSDQIDHDLIKRIKELQKQFSYLFTE